MKTYTYTHIITEGLTNRQLCNKVLKALKDLTGLDQGTMNCPFEDASTHLSDNRTIMQTIKEDGHLRYSDGYLTVEVDYYCVYVDYSQRAIKEYEMTDFERLANDNVNPENK